MPWPEEIPGAVMAGSYRLVRLLGSAGGRVYEARHDRRAGRFAVKLFEDAEPAAFQRGAQHVLALRHPGIVPVIDYGADVANAQGALVMDLVDGPSVAALVRDSGLLPAERVGRIIEGAAAALGAAHAHGVVHGQLAPDRILVARTARGEAARVVGFGLGEEVSAEPMLTEVTPYTAPEQLASDGLAESDQFALAAIAYEMLTGVPPFDDSTAREQPPSIRDFAPEVNVIVDDVIRKALAPDPEDRWADVQMFAQRLREAADGALEEKTRIAPMTAFGPETPAPNTPRAEMYGDDEMREMMVPTPAPVTALSFDVDDDNDVPTTTGNVDGDGEVELELGAPTPAPTDFAAPTPAPAPRITAAGSFPALPAALPPPSSTRGHGSGRRLPVTAPAPAPRTRVDFAAPVSAPAPAPRTRVNFAVPVGAPAPAPAAVPWTAQMPAPDMSFARAHGRRSGRLAGRALALVVVAGLVAVAGVKLDLWSRVQALVEQTRGGAPAASPAAAVAAPAAAERPAAHAVVVEPIARPGSAAATAPAAAAATAAPARPEVAAEPAAPPARRRVEPSLIPAAEPEPPAPAPSVRHRSRRRSSGTASASGSGSGRAPLPADLAAEEALLNGDAPPPPPPARAAPERAPARTATSVMEDEVLAPRAAAPVTTRPASASRPRAAQAADDE